jgi:hypothetical protein
MSARSESPPGCLAVALRPLGHLSIGLVWSVIVGVILLPGPVALVLGAVVDGGLELGRLRCRSSPWGGRFASPGSGGRSGSRR